MRISAKVDYAVRALAELAALQEASAPARGQCKGDELARAQEIPPRFLEAILADLRRAGIVQSQRGSEGGYWLARPAAEVTVADVIRAVEGPLADVHGTPPEDVAYSGAASELQRLWIATRVALRQVLEGTTVRDVATGSLPATVRAMADAPDGWSRR